MKINDLLENTIKLNASDLHLTPGLKPIIRLKKDLKVLESYPVLTSENTADLAAQLLNEKQQKKLLDERQIDAGYTIRRDARFRLNVFFAKGQICLAIRRIPFTIPSFKDLNLPEQIKEFTNFPNGLVLVTGAGGMGKSTTLASILDYINETQAKHIVTLEDPIEYLFTNKKSFIQQRELGTDFTSFTQGLKGVLREDINVCLVGEMRDKDTIGNAVTVAETGHMVYATLHTRTAAQSVARIIDVFGEAQQGQIRSQLADNLMGVITQRLVKSPSKGVVPAIEILSGTNAVRSLIREGKIHMIDNVIATSLEDGMLPLEKSLAELVNKGDITKDVAMAQTSKPDVLKRFIN